jgi:hypothetical protein
MRSQVPPEELTQLRDALTVRRRSALAGGKSTSDEEGFTPSSGEFECAAVLARVAMEEEECLNKPLDEVSLFIIYYLLFIIYYILFIIIYHYLSLFIIYY